MLSRTTTQPGVPLTTAEDKTRLYELVLDYVLDIHDSARPEDRGYFRRSREERLKGKTLEQAVADRYGGLGRDPRMHALFE